MLNKLNLKINFIITVITMSPSRQIKEVLHDVNEITN